MAGLVFHEVIPRKELALRLGSNVLDWLTDRQVLDWQLLQHPKTPEPLADWAAVVTVGVAGSGERQESGFPALEAGEVHRLEFRLAGDNLPSGEKLCLDVTLKLRAVRGQHETTQTRQYLVQRARRLAERTEEEDDFESMFGGP
jgi:hypothetical protein